MPALEGYPDGFWGNSHVLIGLINQNGLSEPYLWRPVQPLVSECVFDGVIANDYTFNHLTYTTGRSLIDTRKVWTKYSTLRSIAFSRWDAGVSVVKQIGVIWVVQSPKEIGDTYEMPTDNPVVMYDMTYALNLVEEGKWNFQFVHGAVYPPTYLGTLSRSRASGKEWDGSTVDNAVTISDAISLSQTSPRLAVFERTYDVYVGIDLLSSNQTLYVTGTEVQGQLKTPPVTPHRDAVMVFSGSYDVDG